MNLSKIFVGLCAAIFFGCGNYTNEDIEYQLALPGEDDLSLKLPARQGLSVDSAEYFVLTSGVALQFNGLKDGLLGIIDQIRAAPPSERSPERRVWGPFPHEQDSRWEAAMIMQRNAAGDRFEYSVQFRLRGKQGGGWHELIRGYFLPSGGVRRGAGRLDLNLTAARREGYPIKDLGETTRILIDYQTQDYPVRVDLSWWTLAGGADPVSNYRYLETKDQAGELRFVIRGKDDKTGTPFLLDVQSRWLPGGAGRADATVTPTSTAGALAGLTNIDCWDTSTRATYSARWDKDKARREVGSASTCAFGPPDKP